MNLFKEIKAMICEQLKVIPYNVKLQSTFAEDLAADSLDSMELVIALEEKFNIDIFDEDMAKMKTVEDLVEYIAKKRNKI